MEIIFKKISDMSQGEEIIFNNFYMYSCEAPLFPPTANYVGDETACILLSKGDNLVNGRIIGTLLYRETGPNSSERERFKPKKMFLITRIDVHPDFRGRDYGCGKTLLRKTIAHLTLTAQKPLLIKMEQLAFPGVPERFGFEKAGRIYYYKLIS